MRFPYGNSVFITGGSSGIGRAAAELFAANGYTVFAASRCPQESAASFPGGGSIRPVTMDVRDPESVDAAAQYVLAQNDIGVVIHCAGLGIACAGEDYPSVEVANLMSTNFDGALLVNSRFLPHMRERRSGLCIMTGSVAGLFPIPFQSHYCASKAALDLYSSTLRMELREYGVQICLLMPGDTNTGFTSARKYVIKETSPFYDSCLRAVKKMEKDELGGCRPSKAAQAMLSLSAQKKTPARKIVGLDYKLLVFLRRLLPERAIESILRSMYMGRQN